MGIDDVLEKVKQTQVDYEIKIVSLKAHIEGMEETIREKDQLIANTQAELTELRKALVRICEIAEETGAKRNGKGN